MSRSRPPYWAKRFLQWYCNPRLQEEILGDLEEQFEEDLRLTNQAKARAKFIWNVIRFCRPGIIKKLDGSKKLNQYGMFKNYYKVSIRNILRNKTFTFLNVTGLSVGIASCLLILIYVNNELSYDRYNSKYDRIFRVLHYYGSDVELPEEGTLPVSDFQVWGNAPIAPALKEFFPQIEDIYRFTSWTDLLVEVGGQKFQEKGIAFGDSTAYRIFDWNWIGGNPESALTRPNTIALSTALATKYFGSEDPIGKTLVVYDDVPLEVTAVYEIPPNSHFTCEGFISMKSFQNWSSNIFQSWGYVDFYTYFTINENSSIEELENGIPAFREKYTSEIPWYGFRFEPLPKAYLDSEAQRAPGPVGNKNNIYLFISVAIFILVIASINFMNLSTARSVERAKEVAIRKTIGSHRSALIVQFLFEGLLLTGIAALVAIGVVGLGHPYLELLVGKTMPMEWLFSTKHILMGLSFIIFLGLLTGCYPAFVISRFKPIKVLKGSFKNSSEGVWLRKGLVIVQFSLSIILLVGTTIVYNQLTFLKEYDKGFEDGQILVIDYGFDTQVQQSLKYIKNELLKNASVTKVATSRATPGDFFPNAGTGIQNPSGELVFHDIPLFEIDEDFIPTYEMQLAAGRNYSREHPADSAISLIINESAARLYGYSTPEDALGKNFSQWGREGKVIGILKDFNYQSLHQEVEPMTLRYSNSSTTSMLSLKLSSENYRETLAELESIWNEAVPNYPFVAHFNNAYFNAQYEADTRFGIVFTIFSGLAMFVACLGLFGLTIYNVNQRAKEIGIRKVLGASISGIVKLLSYDFVKLFVLSLLLSVPISWIVMTKWLENFAYQVTIGWEVFVIATLGVLFISLLTISVRTVKAALANPVETLKDE